MTASKITTVAAVFAAVMSTVAAIMANDALDEARRAREIAGRNLSGDFGAMHFRSIEERLDTIEHRVNWDRMSCEKESDSTTYDCRTR